MRILVIGGNGFIGTPLVRELIQDGHEVAVLHRNANVTPNPSTVQLQGDRNRLQDCEAEIRAFAPRVIIDMILSSGKQAEELVSVARVLNARVVAISSMDVYRAWGVLLGTEPGGLEPMPITEDSPVRNASRAYPPEVVTVLKDIFSWLDPDYDKVAVEQAVRNGGSGNTIVRLPMVYGPGDALHRMHPVLKRIADARPAIILPDDYAVWRGPRGYVENVAHAIALAAISEQALGKTYHVCDEPSLTEIDWAKKIAAQTRWSGRFVVIPKDKTPKHLLMPFNASQHLIANSERIRTELGYKELETLDAAIRHTIAWEQANPPTGASFHQFDYEQEDAALAQY
jgi:nucleoside-diphosphate-sugar epimerase